MSDEERLCITENTLQDCMNKISELEKTAKSTNRIQLNDTMRIKNLENNNQAYQASIKECFDQIAELRVKVEKIDHSFGIMFDMHNSFGEQLSELKESNRYTHNRSCVNKGVLQGFIDFHWEMKSLKIPFDDKREGHLKLLEMLDGPRDQTVKGKFHDSGKIYDFEGTIKDSDGKTEKKEFCAGNDCIGCKIDVEECPIAKKMKASGGEKTVKGRPKSINGLKPFSVGHKSDSKPPEPNCKTCLYEIGPPINDCAMHEESGAKVGELVRCSIVTASTHHENYYVPEERVRDATRQELISEFVKSYKAEHPYTAYSYMMEFIATWEDKLK